MYDDFIDYCTHLNNKSGFSNAIKFIVGGVKL